MACTNGCGPVCCPPIPPVDLGGPNSCCCKLCGSGASCGEHGGDGTGCKTCGTVCRDPALITVSIGCSSATFRTCDNVCHPSPCPGPIELPKPGGGCGCGGHCGCGGATCKSPANGEASGEGQGGLGGG